MPGPTQARPSEDPALRPVAAAQAEIDRLAAEAGAGAVFPGSPAPVPSRRPTPKIERADWMAWSADVELQYPLFVDGEPLRKLSLRMLTGGDITRLVLEEDGDHALNVRARALVAGVHPAVFEALAGPDFERVAEAVRPFLPPSLVAADDQAAEALLGAGLSLEG